MSFNPTAIRPNDLNTLDWNFVHVDQETFEAAICHEPRDVTHMIFRDPLGNYGQIAIAPTVQDNGASWTWNHVMTLPTLSPSINVAGGWHGWLRDGYWTDA